MKMNLKKRYKRTRLLAFLLILLMVFDFIPVLITSNVPLLLVHAIVSGSILGFFRINWLSFIDAYIHSECDLDELEDYYSVRSRYSLYKVIFSSGHVDKINNSNMKQAIEVEDAVLSGKKTFEECKEIIDNLISADRGDGFTHYLSILRDIYTEKFEEVLVRLESMTTDNPIFEVPRQFYLAIVLSHLYSPDYPGVNECITYIANKGQKSRYKAYLEKRFEVPEPSVEVKVTEPNRKYLFVTFGFAIFWTLLVLFVA